MFKLLKKLGTTPTNSGSDAEEELQLNRRSVDLPQPSPQREQLFFETFFLLTTQFGYDKAKEFADMERDGGRASSQTWVMILTCLSQLAHAEKSYVAMLFLQPKSFLRKDNSLKSVYEALRAEMRKVEDIGKNLTNDVMEKLLAHICGQLAQFMSARIDLMDFYERSCNMGSGRFMNYEELHKQVTEISKQYQKDFHHPSLVYLKSSVSYECEIITKLLEAQIAMQQWKFLPSLLSLQDAHSKLGAWETLIQPKEQNRKLSFSPTSHNPTSSLYLWLCKLKAVLTSKWSLYFHEILSKQIPPYEMKAVSSKSSVDLHTKLVTFHRKSDAKYLAIVLDASNYENFRGHGYYLPLQQYDVEIKEMIGMECYPPIMSVPQEKPLPLWPNVVMLITDRAAELTTERIVYLYDKNMQVTYFVTRFDPLLTLVILYDNKKSERDSYVSGFLTTISSQLRISKVFANLKPGSK